MTSLVIGTAHEALGPPLAPLHELTPCSCRRPSPPPGLGGAGGPGVLLGGSEAQEGPAGIFHT